MNNRVGLGAIIALPLVGLVALLLSQDGDSPEIEATLAQNGPIAFNSGYDIYVMDADGQNPTNLTNDPRGAVRPAWSPDGTKIAFNSSRDDLDGPPITNEIYVMDADGQNPTRLTNNPAEDLAPDFSPDGTKIAFHSVRDGNGEIYVMDADGQNQTNLTNNAGADVLPAFSPDGTKIAFASYRDGNAEIYVMDADGQNQTRLTNIPADDYDPAFSPDGSKIAFLSYRAATYSEIYVMDADGQNQTRLTSTDWGDTSPSFSPDGTKIAFSSWRDGDYEIYVMDADGQNPTSLTNNEFVDDGFPDWSSLATPPAPTVADLIASVEALDLPPAIERSLLKKLDGAQRNLDGGDLAGACDKLASFISQVGALRGKKIPADDADKLIGDAEAVRESLGCDTA